MEINGGGRKAGRQNHAPLSLPAGLLLILGLGIWGCADKPPEISRVFWQVNIIDHREQELLYPSLALFVQADDPDGLEDLEEIYLINDTEELFWRIDSESWLKNQTGEATWIGTNAIAMPGGAHLPAGTYRVLLRDLSGEEAEYTFHLPRPPRRFRESPQIAIKEGMITVAGTWTRPRIWVYGADQNYLRSFPLDSGSLSLEKVVRTDNRLTQGFSFKVYALDRDLGLISGPFYVNP